MATTTKKRPSPKALLKKWIKALRSGEYKQCRETLQSGNKYCCLGVYATILPKSVGAKVQVFDENDVWGGKMKVKYRKDASSSSLPIGLLKRIGLDDNEQGDLIELNDDKRKGFKAIANYVEKNILPRHK